MVKALHWLLAIIVSIFIGTVFAEKPFEEPFEEPFAGDLTDTITTQQTAYFQMHGKYQQIKPVTKDNVTYQVIEYDGPEGKGYNTYITTVTPTEWKMQSIDSGAEPWRNYTITEPITASTTK